MTPVQPAPDAAVTEADSRSRVLLVEDDPDQLQLLLIYFQRAKCRVHPTPTGEVAAALIASGEPIDLALIDLNLPGILGDAVATLLHNAQPDCEIVLTSVLEPTEMPAGARMLPKPYTRAEILGLLRRDRPRPVPRSGSDR